MEVTGSEPKKRPLFIAAIAGYMLFMGLLRAGLNVASFAQGDRHIPRMSMLTLGFLFTGLALLSRRWWVRRFALGMIIASTLDMLDLAGHLVAWGVQRYAPHLATMLLFLLWNVVMFVLLTRRSARDAFQPEPRHRSAANVAAD